MPTMEIPGIPLRNAYILLEVNCATGVDTLRTWVFS